MNSSQTKRSIDLVFPCFNPHKGWADDLFAEYKELVKLMPEIEFGVIVVNDGSSSGFSEEETVVLTDNLPGIRIISYNQNRGKGYALREGVGACKSPLIVYTDYDFPYDLESVRKVIEKLIAGSDIVIATRDKHYYEQLSPYRRFYSLVSKNINKLILRLDLPDTQGGLKGFNLKGKEVFLQTEINQFLFDTEFIYKASRKGGLKIVSVEAKAREEIFSSRLSLGSLLRELMNFIKILLCN